MSSSLTNEEKILFAVKDKDYFGLVREKLAAHKENQLSLSYVIKLIEHAGIGSYDPIEAFNSLTFQSEVVDYDREKYPFLGKNPLNQRVKQGVVLANKRGDPVFVGWPFFSRAQSLWGFDKVPVITEKPSLSSVKKQRELLEEKIAEEFDLTVGPYLRGEKEITRVRGDNNRETVRALIGLEQAKQSMLLELNEALVAQSRFSLNVHSLPLLSPQGSYVKYLNSVRDDIELTPDLKLALDVINNKNMYSPSEVLGSYAVLLADQMNTVKVPAEVLIGDYFFDIKEILNLPDGDSYKESFLKKKGLVPFQSELLGSTLTLQRAGELMYKLKPRKYRVDKTNEFISLFSDYDSGRKDFVAPLFRDGDAWLVKSMTSLPTRSLLKDKPLLAILSHDELRKAMDLERLYFEAGDVSDDVFAARPREFMQDFIRNSVVVSRKLRYLNSFLSSSTNGEVSVNDANPEWFAKYKDSFSSMKNASFIPLESFYHSLPKKISSPLSMNEIKDRLLARPHTFSSHSEYEEYLSNMNWEVDLLPHLFINFLCFRNKDEETNLELLHSLVPRPGDEVYDLVEIARSDELTKMDRLLVVPNTKYVLPREVDDISRLAEVGQRICDERSKLDKDVLSRVDSILRSLRTTRSIRSGKFKVYAKPEILDVNEGVMYTRSYELPATNPHFLTAEDVHSIYTDFKSTPLITSDDYVVLNKMHKIANVKKFELQKKGVVLSLDEWKTFKNARDFDYITPAAQTYVNNLHTKVFGSNK